MATEAAPVCLLPNRSQMPPLQSGRRYPVALPAVDLPSAIQAVNTLAQIINIYLGSPLALPNNLVPFNVPSLSPSGGGTTGIINAYETGPAAGKGENGKDAKSVRFTEEDRVTQHIKVVNPDDDDQFVFVERISSVTFYDSVTDGRFTWEGIDLG